jgi:hypothetical protein
MLNSCTYDFCQAEPIKLAQQLSPNKNFLRQKTSKNIPDPVIGTPSHPRNSCKWVDQLIGMPLMTSNSQNSSCRNLSSNVAKQTRTIKLPSGTMGDLSSSSFHAHQQQQRQTAPTTNLYGYAYCLWQWKNTEFLPD